MEYICTIRLTPVTTTSMMAVRGSTRAVTFTTTRPTSSQLCGEKVTASESLATEIRAHRDRPKLPAIASAVRWPATEE